MPAIRCPSAVCSSQQSHQSLVPSCFPAQRRVDSVQKSGDTSSPHKAGQRGWNVRRQRYQSVITENVTGRWGGGGMVEGRLCLLSHFSSGTTALFHWCVFNFRPCDRSAKSSVCAKVSWSTWQWRRWWSLWRTWSHTQRTWDQVSVDTQHERWLFLALDLISEICGLGWHSVCMQVFFFFSSVTFLILWHQKNV